MAKRSGASRPRSQVPGWVWLFTGIVTGLFIAFLARLAEITPSEAPPQQADKRPAAEDKPATETRFDFYTLLPEREIIVPQPKEQPAQSAREPAEAMHYILQAGSFKTPADAERRRAELGLLGYESRVETVTANGDTWHRVQVGPFTSRSKLAKARQTLVSEGIDTLLLKRKADS